MRSVDNRMSAATTAARPPCETRRHADDARPVQTSANRAGDRACTPSCKSACCCWRRHRIHNPVSFQAGVCHSCPFGIRSLNPPVILIANKRHLLPAAPPSIDVAGERGPQPGAIASFAEVLKQPDIDVALASAHEVIRMCDEADKAVMPAHDVDLSLPGCR